MKTSRSKAIEENIELLIEHFSTFLKIFDKRPPFSRFGQFEYHEQTIKQRLSCGSVTVAINDDIFLKNLYKTLQAWGIGSRGSRLVPFSEFKNAMTDNAEKISRFEGVRIDDVRLDTKKTSDELWQLIDSLPIVENNAKLVAGSKALHHLLPDLVPPIDRAYTCNFFLWNSSEFQYKQKKFLSLAFENFAKIARAVNPSQYVGVGWHTSQTKVLDNAVVGFLLPYKHMPQNQGSS